MSSYALTAHDCREEVSDANDPLLVNVPDGRRGLFRLPAVDPDFLDPAKSWVVPIIAAMDRGAFDTPALNYGLEKALAHLRAAREAYRSGQLSRNQFVTLILQWQLRDDLAHLFILASYQHIYLFDALGKLSPEAKRIFGPHLTEAQLKEFERLLRKAPESEKYALIAEHNVPITDQVDPLFATMQAYGPFSMFFGPNRFTLPSFSALQLFLDMKFGNDAMEMIPQFDLAPDDTVLRMAEQNQFPLALGFPGEERPSGTHGIGTRSFTAVTLHDVLHAHAGSSLSRVYRASAFDVYHEIEQALPGEDHAELKMNLSLFPSALVPDMDIVSRLNLDIGGIDPRYQQVIERMLHPVR